MIPKSSEILYKKDIIKRKMPINICNHDNFYQKVNLKFKEVKLFCYQNVCVTPEGNVLKKFTIDKDLFIFPSHKKKYNLLYILSTYFKRKKILLPENETYILCFDYWSNSIFHWMCDVLPRLEAVKQLATNCIFLLPRSYEYNYIKETLKAFNFKNIYFIEDNTYVLVKKLYVPDQITPSGQIRPDNIKQLRITLLSYFKPKPTTDIENSNIYISRNKAKYRRVLNEDELLPILYQNNFKIIFFEDLNVSQQVELCFNAKNIVSIHGANLTNIIFLQAGSNIFEFRKKGDQLNNYFYELADSIDCNYYFVNCEFEDPIPNYNFFNLYVNPVEFEATLKVMLKK